MPPKKDKLVLAISRQVLAFDYIIEADREAMLSLISAIAAAHGVSTLDEMSLRTWFFQKRKEHLLNALVKLEDESPDTAIYIQSVIEDSTLLEG